MSSVSGQRERILSPYTRRVDDARHRATKIVGISALVLLAMIIGYALAVFGSFGWFIPAIPITVLVGVALWIAPDVGTDLQKPISKIFFIYFTVLLVWPNYIAINIPGLPWISMARLIMFPLALLALYAIATSSSTRHDIAEVLRSHRIMTRIFLAWVVWQTIMQVVGGFAAPGRWVQQMLAFYLLFVVLAWIFTVPGRAVRTQQVVLASAVVVSLITLWEIYVGYTPWAFSIPSFFDIDPSVLESLAKVQVRSGEYRATSIFLSAVTYGEFIGITLPFVVYAIISAPTPKRMALASMALILHFTAALYNNSRSAMVAYVVVFSAFAGMWTWRRFRSGKARNDLVATAITVTFPAILLMVAAGVLTIGRVRRRVLGGPEHAASNAGREAQWDMALPVIGRNPFGYGMGTVQDHVPFTNLAGAFTLDSYPINLLVEVGVPGFLLFFGFFICAIITGVLVYVRAQTRDEEIAGVVALSLLSFLITRLVFSSETGHIYVYPLAGVILSQWYVQRKRQPAITPAEPIKPLYGIPPRAAPALHLSNAS